jgi:hypothetical protein
MARAPNRNMAHAESVPVAKARAERIAEMSVPADWQSSLHAGQAAPKMARPGSEIEFVKASDK